MSAQPVATAPPSGERPGGQPAERLRSAPDPSGSALSAADIAAALRLPPPTEEQAAVVQAAPEPLLVVAGAGSGKTETMAARVVWLVANRFVEPDRVLGLTFTRKAAGELADRVRARLRALARAGMLPVEGALAADGARPPAAGSAAPEELGEPTVSTYHSYAAGVLADHGARLGVEPGARLVGEAAAWQIATRVVEAADDLPGVDAAPSTVVAAVLSLAGECSEHLADPDAVDDALQALLDAGARLPGRSPAAVRALLVRVAGRRAVVPLVRAYAQRKRELEVFDHGDQVALAARAAAAFPAVGAVERDRWGVVLLDEYQDTSSAQAQLLVSLFGGGHPVTAVGDPHQSIYGWRGASAGGLEDFAARFPRADGSRARVTALSTSWRNDEVVLAAAGAVAEPLRATSRLPLPALAPRPGAGAGRVEVLWRETATEEADAVADVVARAWRAPGERSAAVLCRARAQFRPLEEALRARGLPVEVVGVGGLLERPEVVDVVAALRVVADPGRGDAVLRLLTGPRWRLGPRDLRALSAWARRDDAPAAGPAGAGSVASPARGPERRESAGLADAVDDPPPPGWRGDDGLSAAGRARAGELAGVLRRLRAATALPLPDLVTEVERALGLDVELAARPGTSTADARGDLDAFTDVAATFAADHVAAASSATPAAAGAASAGAVLPAFLAWLDAAAARERGLDLASAEEEAAEAGQRRAVQLLTVHAAKGLEWDVVAVPGLVRGLFPSSGGARTSGWVRDWGALPYPLRGDAASLPAFAHEGVADAAGLGAAHEAFVAACTAHAEEEERRLAYVALTRAREHLVLSGAWWGTGQRPREPSPFLRDVLGALRRGGAPVVDLPAAPVEPSNPVLRAPRTASWPADPLAERRGAVEAAAAAVRSAAARLAGSADRPGPEGASPAASTSPWEREVDRLLAERDATRDGAPQVVLPAHLSASRLVDLAADPRALALALRRPVPVRPREATRRGTLFHAWLEQRFGAPTLMDLDDPADPSLDRPDTDEDAPGEDGGSIDIAALQVAFLASEWAQRTPLAVEVDLETLLAGLVVRCRVDAVFARPDGGVDVVDWKTGAPPTGARARAAAVQLAVYRLAWSRLHGVPLEQVGAAFYYAARGVTARPVDLLDAAGLEALVSRLPQRADGVEDRVDERAGPS